ncbi:MAG: META domain-containing protein [Pseudomonadota bacterium]
MISTLPMRRWWVAAVTVATLGGCVDSESGVDEASPTVTSGQSSRDALDWAGRYRGLILAADGEALDTAITLREDGTYEYALQFLKPEDARSVEIGTFTWSPEGDRVMLRDVGGDGTALEYQVGESALFQLNGAGVRIAGASAEQYRLAKGVVDPRIEGIEWRLVQLEGAVIAMEGTRTIDLTLADGRAFGSAYCNRFTGPYDVLAGEHLLLGPHFAGTRMGCANDMLEQRYLRMLPAVRTYHLENRGYRLQLSDSSGLVRAVFELNKKLVDGSKFR